MARYTINCEPDQKILAARALEYAENEMPHGEAILLYGNEPNQVQFLVRRTKAGFSARQLT